jgi:PAS domain S-box-containing protein
MLRAPKTRTIFYVALIVAAIIAVSAIPQLSAAVKEGRTLTLVEDIILDLLIGCFVFVGPAGLMLWHQLRRLDRYQQTINDEKRKLDTAINHMTQGLVMFDSAQRIALRNRRYCELYGLSPEIVRPGLSFRDLLMLRRETGSLLEDVDEVFSRVAESLVEGKVLSVIRPAKNGRLVRIASEPLESGGWVATHEDVTERQQLLAVRERAETLAREKSAQLDAALNNMAHGLCLYDAEGRIIVFNRRHCELMGENENHLQGLLLVDVLRRRAAAGGFLPDPGEYVASILAKVRAGEIASVEVPGANNRILRVVRHPIEAAGWVATFEDITEQRNICSVDRCRQAVSASSFGCGAARLPTSHSLPVASAAEVASKISRATSVRVEHALIRRHGFPGGGKLIGGRVGRILGGRQAAESEKTSHQQHARFGRGQIGAGDEIVMRVGEAFGAAAADSHNRQASIDCSLQHVLPDRRGHRSIRRQTFGDKSAKSVGEQLLLHQRHEIGRHRRIVEIFLGEITAVLNDRHRRNGVFEKIAARISDFHFNKRQRFSFGGGDQHRRGNLA